MRFYLSAASAEVEMAAAWIARLEAAGHTCVHDWTVERRLNPGPDSQHGGVVAAELALDETSAIRDCDVFWMLIPPVGTPTAGAWFELGYAVANDIDMLVVSGDYRRSIFTSFADRAESTHEAAFDFIVSRR